MRPFGRPPTPSATSRERAPVGMTAISSRGPPEPSRMTEPLPNCRSICEMASSRACRRSFFASAMRLSFIYPRTLAARFVRFAFGHSRWPFSGPSMSEDSDRASERYRGQLGIAGSARVELAAHQERARHAHPTEFPHAAAREGLAERRIPPGSPDPPEGDVGRERPLLAVETARRQRRVDTPRELDHLGRAVHHAGPDHARPSNRWERAETADPRLEGMQIRSRPAERGHDGREALLGHPAEKLQREVKVSRGDPRDVAGDGTQPLDRRIELAANGLVEQDRDERANARYGAESSSWSRFRIPWRRSESVSAASAARRSVRAPS